MSKNSSFLNPDTLILSSKDIQQVIAQFGLNELMDQLIARMKKAIAEMDPTNTIIPARSGFHYHEPNLGLVEWMPILKYGDAATIKVVGYHPHNPLLYNIPTILSTISSYDTATGHLVGIIDGVLPTALRTGAASAVASSLMAHPDSKVLGLIGCGAQAVTQLHALSRIFKLTEVYLYDVSEITMANFAERCSVLNLSVKFFESTIEEIIAVSDIVCTATSIDVGEGPLFQEYEAKPHLHINAVGADFPGKVELPLKLLKESFVCPDFLDQAVVEGECQQLSSEDIATDWVDIVRYPEKYEEVKSRKSVFDSTGWALEDQIVMELFMECAAELGLGQSIKIESIDSDSKNPYQFMRSEVPTLIAR